MLAFHPEPLAAADVLRMLKGAFPELYRQVWYEAIPPQGKSFDSPLILPEGVQNAGNGQRKVANDDAVDMGPIGPVSSGEEKSDG